MTKFTASFIVHDDFSHIEKALVSLFDNTNVPFVAHLTINHGNNEIIDSLRKRFPHLKIEVNLRPLGFAANHNSVMKQAQTPFVALLNDDIFVHPGALNTMVSYLEANPDVGLVGPLIENPDGTPQQSAFSDPSLLRMVYAISGLGYLTRHNGFVRKVLQRLGVAQILGVESLRKDLSIRPVPAVVGVAMVVRSEAYRQAGLMDEDTRFYGEEFGWHLRLRRQGWKVVFVPTTRITHFNTSQELSGWKLAEHRKAILCYFLRYKTRWETKVLRFTIFTLHGVRGTFLRIAGRKSASDHFAAAKIAFHHLQSTKSE
jgi:GT2 family glycosyltransferase